MPAVRSCCCLVHRILLIYLLLHCVSADDTIATLRHGGQLKGRRVEVNGQVVDQFVGVRYAKPPVGDRRFRKPEKVDSWTGITDATDSGDVCIQYAADILTQSFGVVGNEDCLYLDITVPDGVNTTANKAVMVWIHGGGYAFGTGSIYIGAPLALQGDVIVVAINYRLGVLGFLSDENMGTGNYGLWDQQAAIMWVKENIPAFGGDPNNITIFGESAGAGSVVSQMLGAQNDGLFQRVIAQSGSMYVFWNWFLTLKQRADMAADLKNQMGCNRDVSVFECLRNQDSVTLINMTMPYLSLASFKPVPDDDFFPADIGDQTYNLTSRFDLLIGYNQNEVGLLSSVFLAPYFMQFNESRENGISMAATQAYLRDICKASYTESAVELCADYFMTLYGIKSATNDTQRLLALMNQMKHRWFNTDTTNLLQLRSPWSKANYAYQLKKFVNVPRDRQQVPPPLWMTPEADHGADLFYVFGFDKFHSNFSEATNYTLTQLADDATLKHYIRAGAEFATENDTKFSEKVQTFWTNFAKTGNPNTPHPVNGTSWPEFTSDNPKFMSLSDDMASIDAPDLAIHNEIISMLYPSRRRKVAADIPPQVVVQVRETTGPPCDTAKADPIGHASQFAARYWIISFIVTVSASFNILH